MKTNEEIAKDIIGNWGYEEEAWWRPIFEALEAKDERYLNNEKFREENGEPLIELDSCDKEWKKRIKEALPEEAECRFYGKQDYERVCGFNNCRQQVIDNLNLEL